uniref:Uncharacterized protein n=1 Tax=Fagus sylvatica TaxID=28930 RepID=A0A2N9GY51_FAGSY
MYDDLIGEYETFQNAKGMWDQLKFDFGGTSTARLRSLVLKFKVYRKDPKHTMTEHLRMMFGMIRDLKVARNVLTDEQQVQARQEATKFAALITHGGQHKPNGFKRKDKGKAASSCTWHARLGHIGKDRMASFGLFQTLVAEVENQHEKSLKALRADRGREYFTAHKYGKLGPRARKHIFIRYSDSSKGYVMHGEHPNGGMTEIESRDIDFIETNFPNIGEANRDLDLYELEEDEDTLPSSSEGGGLVPRPVIAEDSGSGLQPSRSVILDQDSQARRMDEPASFSEALHSPDRDEWMTVMQEEMSSMDKNNVWELVDLPPGRKTIGNKWVLKVEHKADGSIDRGHERKVCRLKRSIYGLKQSSRQWYLRFHDSITSFGFEMIEEDHCVYLKQSKRSILILSLYVDDILLAGNDMDSIVTTKKWLSSTFEMKDMGEANFVLGSNPGLAHWRAVKRILRYLRGTIDHALCYHGGDLRLTGYSDADWASDKDERKSTSGYAFILRVAVQEAVWLRRFLQRLGVTAHAEDAVLLYYNSSSALAYAKDPKYHGKTKHIEFRYHYIQDMVSQGK